MRACASSASTTATVGLSQKWDGVLPEMSAVSKAVAAGRKPDIPYTLADLAGGRGGDCSTRSELAARISAAAAWAG